MRQLEFPENIQAIVGGKEYSLDNTVLKIWPESEETNGEYASAIRSFKHNLDIQKIHINFDITSKNAPGIYRGTACQFVKREKKGLSL